MPPIPALGLGTGAHPLSRRCARCGRLIGQHTPEDMVMVVHARRVRWLHDGCARMLWAGFHKDRPRVVAASEGGAGAGAVH
jgi:hypothetical protein